MQEIVQLVFFTFGHRSALWLQILRSQQYIYHCKCNCHHIIVSAIFTNMVTNNYIQIIRQPAGLKLTPRDPRWIGAWWPGFLIFGSAILLWALIILGFPREMPGAKDLRAKHISQGHLKRANGVEIPRFKDILPELKHLLTNWTFLFNTLALSILMLFASPIATFFAKILRLKFGLDPMTTGYVLALISILSIARTFVYKMLFSKSCRGH